MTDTMTLDELKEAVADICAGCDTQRSLFTNAQLADAIDAAIKQREQDKRDAARMEWYFWPSNKKDWLDTYMRGMREGRSVDQWRAAIDTEMAQESRR